MYHNLLSPSFIGDYSFFPAPPPCPYQNNVAINIWYFLKYRLVYEHFFMLKLGHKVVNYPGTPSHKCQDFKTKQKLSASDMNGSQQKEVLSSHPT